MKTEQAVKTNSGFLLAGLMILTLIGFYPTYISKFPDFEGVTTIHHFHGAMMMSWFLMLIVQPFLIRYKKFEAHRTLGKISYAVAPLVLYSIFIASKAEYFRDASQDSEEYALGGLALDMTCIAAFAVCYGLAIWHRKFTPHHKRYMIGTALIIMGPGLVRILIIYELLGTWSFEANVMFTSAITIVIALVLISYDLVNGYSPRPYLVTIGLIIGLTVVFSYRYSGPWQAIASTIAATF